MFLYYHYQRYICCIFFRKTSFSISCNDDHKDIEMLGVYTLPRTCSLVSTNLILRPSSHFSFSYTPKLPQIPTSPLANFTFNVTIPKENLRLLPEIGEPIHSFSFPVVDFGFPIMLSVITIIIVIASFLVYRFRLMRRLKITKQQTNVEFKHAQSLPDLEEN